MQIFKSPSLIANRLLLVVCLMLPWLNPFTSAPSTSVVPLLLSWMLVACAMLLVVDEAPAYTTSSYHPFAPSKVVAIGEELSPKAISFFIRVRQTSFQNKWCLLLVVWFLVSALTVPAVIDRALTVGVVAAVACICDRDANW